MQKHSVFFKALFSLSLITTAQTLVAAQLERETPHGEKEFSGKKLLNPLEKLSGYRTRLPDRSKSVAGVAGLVGGHFLRNSDNQVSKALGFAAQLGGAYALLDDQIPGGVSGLIKWARASDKEREAIKDELNRKMVAQYVEAHALKSRFGSQEDLG